MIYVAGKYISKERLRLWRQLLRDMDYNVSSSWLDETLTESFDDSSMPPPYYQNVATEPQMLANAKMDMDEVLAADTIVLDTLDPSETGGREVELGLALGKGADFVLVGPKRNIFHHLAGLQFDTWDDLMASAEANRAMERNRPEVVQFEASIDMELNPHA